MGWSPQFQGVNMTPTHTSEVETLQSTEGKDYIWELSSNSICLTRFWTCLRSIIHSFLLMSSFGNRNIHAIPTWASLLAQRVKNPPTMQETLVRSLGWEDSPGEGNGYPLQYSGLETSMDMWHVVAKSQTRLSDFHYYYTNSSKLSWLLILFFHLNFTSLYFYQNCLVVWFWQLLF